MRPLIGLIVGCLVGAGIYKAWHTPIGALVAILTASVIALSIAKSQR
jgi:hypothetical protein